MKTTNYIYTVKRANGSEIVIEKPYLDIQIVGDLYNGTIKSVRAVERDIVVEYA